MRHLFLIPAVAGLLLASACGSNEPGAEPTAGTSTAAPETTAAPEPTVVPEPTVSMSEPASEAAGTEPAASGTSGPVVEAYYVRSGPRDLFVEPELRRLPAGSVAVAKGALTAVVEGAPRDPALSTVAPDGTEVLGVTRRDAVIVLDVSDEVTNGNTGSAGEIIFAQQLAHTAAQFDGVRAVRLLVEGRRITELWGHLDWSRPVRPDAFAVSPVVVTHPAHRATVQAGTITAGGTANVFEATVVLTLRRPDGTVHKRTFATATCGTGCRGDWERRFRNVTEPGTWTLIAGASDPSGGEEGFPPYKTRRKFTVR